MTYSYAHAKRELDPIRALRISGELHARITKYAEKKHNGEFSAATRALIERGLVVAADEQKAEAAKSARMLSTRNLTNARRVRTAKKKTVAEKTAKAKKGARK